MLELLAGALISLSVLVVVLEPLTRARGATPQHSPGAPELIDPEELDSPKIRALTALREVEFDRATGKLSDEDYTALKERFSAAALEAIKQEEAQRDDVPEEPWSSAADRAVDEAIRKAREGLDRENCPVCSSRLEHAAIFCSDCGCYLAASSPVPRCTSCGATLSNDGSFCERCGSASGKPGAVG